MSYGGFVFYRGPSQLDGAPILGIVTGLGGSKSHNAKTGHMLQTWIIREDVSPIDAVNTGKDSSVCGSCVHRGESKEGKNSKRSCYVQIFQAPRSVYASYQRGIYPELPLNIASHKLAGQKLRLGSYGDPAAIPLTVWECLLEHVSGHTGYTHQWRKLPMAYSRILMASCDSDLDRKDANALGYRTFRVTSESGLGSKDVREVICPASKQAGFKTDCANCLACGGLTARAKADIVIALHGSAPILLHGKDRVT